MNKKQKIIVSITGIILVLLILVGLTYAYFLTRIQGNTNTKSISVTTANLAIVYGDGTPLILTAEKIQPSKSPIGTKTFTVTNAGTLSTYLNKLKAGNWCYDDSAYTTNTGEIKIADMSSYYENNTSFFFGGYTRL